MNKLEQAARALLAHWDTPAWKYMKPTSDLMADLREALAEQAEQEQVCIDWDTKTDEPIMGYAAPVRTKDPCHPWQDLTDDEIEAIFKSHIGKQYDDFARAVIAADREKNK